MKRGIIFCYRFILSIILMQVVVSCRTMQSSESADSVKVQYISLHTRDSLFVYDSVRIRERADTVFITRVRTHYRDRMHTDTLWLRDTVTNVVREVVATEPRRQFPWCKTVLMLLLFLVLWRSGLFSLLRRLINP